MEIAADTWGISGPTFLALYAAMAVGTLLFRVVFVRVMQNSHTAYTPVTPYEIAYLAGGGSRATLAAFTKLHSNGHISRTAEKHYTANTALDREADPLEHDIWQSIHNGGSNPRNFHSIPAVQKRLKMMREKLIHHGYLLTPTRRLLTFVPFVVFLAVFGVGVARVAAEISNDTPVSGLVVLIAVFFITGLIATLAPPHVTTLGRDAVREAQREHRRLEPATLRKNPSRSIGARETALGVALFGGAVLWSMDPELASDTQDSHTSSGMGGGDGGGGGGDGGGGDGGGGGCGGGGGGCGGG